MAIESSPFGSTTLSGEDAARFLRHIQEDGPNPRAIAAYKRGKVVLQSVFSREKLPARCAPSAPLAHRPS